MATRSLAAVNQLPRFSKRETEDRLRDPLWTITDVARRLQLSEVTIRKLMVKGDLRFTRVAGRIRFKPEWIEEYIDRIER